MDATMPASWRMRNSSFTQPLAGPLRNVRHTRWVRVLVTCGIGLRLWSTAADPAKRFVLKPAKTGRLIPVRRLRQARHGVGGLRRLHADRHRRVALAALVCREHTRWTRTSPGGEDAAGDAVLVTADGKTN
jgi:hypothetical protein